MVWGSVVAEMDRGELALVPTFAMAFPAFVLRLVVIIEHRLMALVAKL